LPVAGDRRDRKNWKTDFDLTYTKVGQIDSSGERTQFCFRARSERHRSTSAIARIGRAPAAPDRRPVGDCSATAEQESAQRLAFANPTEQLAELLLH
jgi:hypothetical protein